MRFKNIANSNELQKDEITGKKEVFLTKEVRGRLGVQVALFSGLITLLAMLVMGKDGE